MWYNNDKQDQNWSTKEHTDIISCAVQIYLEKRRKVQLHDGHKPKIQRLEKSLEIVEEESSWNKDDSQSDSDLEDNDKIFETSKCELYN